MAQPIPITNGFYTSDSLPISAQQCINWYVNNPQAPGITDANLFAVPGITQILKLSDINPCRGGEVMDSIPYVVIDTVLYSIDQTISTEGDESFSSTAIGGIVGSGLVSMDTNGDQLAIVVPGVEAYIYDKPTGILATITDVNFDGPVDSVRYVDGFFTFVTTSGKKFINSPRNDGRGLPSGTAYDPLDFSVADADPDDIRGQVELGNRLYVLGSVTTQVFSNIGRSPEPFEAIDGFVLDKGLSAKFSLVEAQSSFVMIGAGKNESPAVWSFTGNGYDKISTTAIDNLLSELTNSELDEVEAWAYGETGHYFVGFNLVNTTIVYDFVTRKWHERKSQIGSNWSKYRVGSMLSAYGRIIVCDNTDGTIGELDKNVFTEYGNIVRCQLTTQPFDNNGNPLFLNYLEAVMENGVGNSAAPDPVLRYSFSDDGARTFSSELFRKIGKVGEYQKRIMYRRLGNFPRSRVLRFECSDPVKRTFIKLEADFA